MPAIEFSSPHILRTKLYRPPAFPDLEQRTRLLDRLNRNIQRPLTLISAPAGYGKTVLASQWLETCDYPSAWFSIDESDNDLGVFVSYLLTTISSTFPDLTLKTLNLMAVPNLPPVSALAQALINDLDQIEEPYILVLDDIHRIHHPEICNLLDLLLQYPPHNLHLVLIGRHDPAFEIISLRARSLVTEIRTYDLRFTPQETACLMRRMLNREVNPAVAADWAQRTDGWVTALRLAVLSLRHRGQDDDLSLHVRGDSRYLRDYLLAEVITRLPRHYQTCLIKIAFLERFCAPLCEAICQEEPENELEGLNGETFIAWLESENLFLIPLDDRHQWFRFHHLFQELLLNMLKAQLNTEEISALQMRASSWFDKNGLFDEAIQYAFVAGEILAAAHLVEQHRYELMNTEQWFRLKRWLNLLPAEAVMQNPRLVSATAFWAIQFGDFNTIVSSVQRAEQLLVEGGPGYIAKEQIQAELAVIYAILGLADQPAQDFEQFQICLNQLPPQALHIRSLGIFVSALSLQMLGDFKRAATIIREELAKNSWPAAFQAKLMHYLSLVCIHEGDLNGVLRTAPTGLQIAEKLSLPESLSWCRYDLGIAHYLRNELAQAELYLRALLEDRYFAPSAYLTSGFYALALIYLSQGRNSEIGQVIGLLEATFQEMNEKSALAMTAAIKVELLLRENRLKEAQSLGGGIEYDLIPPHWLLYVPQLTSIRLLSFEESSESLQEARDQLEIFDENMRKIRRNNVRIDVLVLLALVCDRQGDEPSAFENLSIALDLGSKGRNIRTFVDLGKPMANLLRRLKAQKVVESQTAYLDQLLAAFPETPISPAHMSQSQLDEPLTDRELEVLALLAQRLSNKEIAAELVISPRTVKRHTLNIYQKLDVNSRLQAVERSSKLGIL